MNSPTSQTPRPPATGAIGFVLAGSVALTILMAWPVIRHPTERIFGVEVVGRHHDPFTVMQQFGGAPIGREYLQPATDWTGRAFASVMPPIAAYNLVVLLSFPLAAWFAYLFARAVTKSTPASVVAAFAFAFSPFHLAQAIYHPHVAQVQWVPLYFLMLWKCARGFTWPRAAGLMASAAVAVLANDYHALILAGLTPLALPLFWLIPGQPRRLRDLVRTIGVLAVPAVTGLAVIRYAAPSIFSDATAAARDDLFIYSARWWSYLVPSVDHPVFATSVASLWTRYGIGDGLLEQQVYVGWILLALCGVALVTWWRHREAVPFVPAFLTLALLAVACSLSPERTLLGVTWPRPSALLFQWLPMFRSYGRFAVAVQCFASVTAGAGFAALWQQRGTRRTLALAMVAALGFEYAPVYPRWRDVLPTSAHRWLAQQTPPSPAFECSRLSLADANVSWLLQRPLAYLGPIVPDCGEPQLSAKLRRLGYQYLIVRADRPERRYLGRHADPDLSRVYHGMDADVFAITAPAAPLYLADLDGLDTREYDETRTWRWAGAKATLPIFNNGATPEVESLGLELSAFGVPRHVTASLDGRVIATVLVRTEMTPVVLGPMSLAPGRHDLVIESAEPAISPASIAAGPDTRLLALRVGRWWWVQH